MAGRMRSATAPVSCRNGRSQSFYEPRANDGFALGTPDVIYQTTGVELNMTHTRNLWEDTRTFFPLFQALIRERDVQTVCVVDASDGTFVLPPARNGIRVVAIEPDKSAVNGGPITLPGPIKGTLPGLRKRVADKGLSHLVEIGCAGPAEACWARNT
ncbi:hypothetical protein QLQ12_07000 [Actinoplanes sp. NEAU-A12]|uniref:Uncharacterized protein n=1 Tax=Actinoplanes sandaracinus TaxID=3045177 RepID=A0ABT6WF49_9ACTN|nr:hypothetical protein [Actinoplanes sandaracinus]MDI6098348.1 hypothetical protein [Actinoplanes sandaracinus]